MEVFLVDNGKILSLGLLSGGFDQIIGLESLLRHSFINRDYIKACVRSASTILPRDESTHLNNIFLGLVVMISACQE